MAGETPITVVGNLTADPELRFTPSGAAVANFTVASTPRTFDRQTNEWKDQETLFLNCSVWRQAAENAAESLTRGMRVIVQGRLKARSYETREGEKRTVFEIDVEEVGPSLKMATAKVHEDQPLRRWSGLRRRRPVGQQPGRLGRQPGRLGRRQPGRRFLGRQPGRLGWRPGRRFLGRQPGWRPGRRPVRPLGDAGRVPGRPQRRAAVLI